jgi:hypothetical protein
MNVRIFAGRQARYFIQKWNELGREKRLKPGYGGGQLK